MNTRNLESTIEMTNREMLKKGKGNDDNVILNKCRVYDSEIEETGEMHEADVTEGMGVGVLSG